MVFSGQTRSNRTKRERNMEVYEIRLPVFLDDFLEFREIRGGKTIFLPIGNWMKLDVFWQISLEILSGMMKDDGIRALSYGFNLPQNEVAVQRFLRIGEPGGKMHNYHDRSFLWNKDMDAMLSFSK